MTVPVIDIAIRTRNTDEAHMYVYTTVVLKYDIPLSEQITKSNTKYIVKWNHDLDGDTINIPENCIIEFDGGMIYNGSIVWNNTKVLNLYSYTILEDIVERGIRTTLGGNI